MSDNRMGAALRGLAAGAVGIAAMDLLWYVRYRRDDGDDGFRDWEFSAGTNDWEHAAAPGQVGRKIAEGLFGVALPDEVAAATNNVVHWATGLQWGALYGIAASANRRAGLAAGLLLGTVAWSTSYVVLPLAKVYKPIWEYDARTLWKDYSAHLVFGGTAGCMYRLLSADSMSTGGH
jgi:hypothetical protein